jgi:F-type H+-transporting ATPase subunit gamma
MTRLAEIQARIGGMGELRDIVGAMRSLAGMRVQEAQLALSGVRHYAEAMAAALASTLPLLPEPTPRRHADRGRRAIVLCTAEHGFVGGFNERLMDAAEAALDPSDALVVLGTRGAALALERGRPLMWTRPMATRAAGAPETVRLVSAELYARIACGEISRVEVMFAGYRQGGTPTIVQSLLLPLDLATLAVKQPRQPPLHNLKPVPLHEKLMVEYVFALLTEAAVESIASENAARFAAMVSAHDNLSKKLDELRQAEREARQDEITTELLEVITGAEALGDEY